MPEVFDRWHRAYSTKQVMGTNGRLACLECGGDITDSRRSTFCKEACAKAFGIKTSAIKARIAVFERDRGFCAKCGKDCFEGQHRPRRARGSGDLWQADHIIPVVEGGGTCGLENYRTLCTSCHKTETAVLATRRAARLSVDQLEFQLAEASDVRPD